MASHSSLPWKKLTHPALLAVLTLSAATGQLSLGYSAALAADIAADPAASASAGGAEIIGAAAVATGGTLKETPPAKAAKPPTEIQQAKDAQIAEAERKYNEALEFYAAGRFARAHDLGQEACNLAPHNARYREALAVFAAQDRPLIDSLAAAKEGARRAPRDANAWTNLGTLYQKNGQRAEAVDSYKKADAISNKDYRPKLGIAQCLCIDGADGMAIADQELRAAVETPQDTVDKWSNLGTAYLIIRNFPAATACFKKALKLAPQDYGLQCMRLKSALAEHDIATVKSLVPDVVCDKMTDPDIALGLALLPDNVFAPELKDKLLKICQRNLSTKPAFFYQFGRNLETVAHLEMAYEAYQFALRAAPGECQYIVSEIGNRLAAGRNDEAVQILGQSSAERNKLVAGDTIIRDKGPFAHVLDCVGELLQSENASVHITRVKFSNVKCGCRIPVMQMKMTIEPGVVFAHIEDAKEYPAVIVYDAKKVLPEGIFKKVRHEGDIIEVLSDSPVQSIPELVRLVQTASDKPDKHIISLWSFLPPPMELPK